MFTHLTRMKFNREEKRDIHRLTQSRLGFKVNNRNNRVVAKANFSAKKFRSNHRFCFNKVKWYQYNYDIISCQYLQPTKINGKKCSFILKRYKTFVKIVMVDHYKGIRYIERRLFEGKENVCTLYKIYSLYYIFIYNIYNRDLGRYYFPFNPDIHTLLPFFRTDRDTLKD